VAANSIRRIARMPKAPRQNQNGIGSFFTVAAQNFQRTGCTGHGKCRGSPCVRGGGRMCRVRRAAQRVVGVVVRGYVEGRWCGRCAEPECQRQRRRIREGVETWRSPVAKCHAANAREMGTVAHHNQCKRRNVVRMPVQCVKGYDGRRWRHGKCWAC